MLRSTASALRLRSASGLPADVALFHEGPSRIVVSTAVPEIVERIARENNIEAVRIGVTMKERLRIDHNAVTCIDSPVDRFRGVFENALEGQLAPQHA